VNGDWARSVTTVVTQRTQTTGSTPSTPAATASDSGTPPAIWSARRPIAPPMNTAGKIRPPRNPDDAATSGARHVILPPIAPSTPSAIPPTVSMTTGWGIRQDQGR
jgi:hypothetical protein